MALHWGIASAGKISHDFVSALKLLPEGNHIVLAVAARNLENALQFAATHNIKDAYQGYENLAKRKDIDIVYVGSLHPQHYEIAKLMLENNKNVLCEKPLCMNYNQAKSLIDLAKQKKLFLMEAVWSRFFPAYIELRNIINSGVLGEILYVSADFGQNICDVERLNTKKLGGGTILDLGIYVLQFAQMVFKSEPISIKAIGNLNEDGVDLSMSCVLSYSNGRTAVLSTHSKVVLGNEAVVVGTKGTVKLPTFWCPVKLQRPDGTFQEFPLVSKGFFNFDNSAGLQFEAEECRICINQGLTESPTMPLSESLTLAKLEDELRNQIGVQYEEDLKF